MKRKLLSWTEINYTDLLKGQNKIQCLPKSKASYKQIDVLLYISNNCFASVDGHGRSGKSLNPTKDPKFRTVKPIWTKIFGDLKLQKKPYYFILWCAPAQTDFVWGAEHLYTQKYCPSSKLLGIFPEKFKWT